MNKKVGDVKIDITFKDPKKDALKTIGKLVKAFENGEKNFSYDDGKLKAEGRADLEAIVKIMGKIKERYDGGFSYSSGETPESVVAAFEERNERRNRN